MNLYKAGKIDAATAMKMMSDLESTRNSDPDSKQANHPQTEPVGCPSKKRERSPGQEVDGDDNDDDLDLDDIGAHLDS